MGNKIVSLSLITESINKIAALYFVAISQLNKRTFISEDNIYFLFTKWVSSSYEKLPEKNKEIINNDFFLDKYPYWWKNKYNYDSYLRLERESIILFWEALNEIN